MITPSVTILPKTQCLKGKKIGGMRERKRERGGKEREKERKREERRRKREGKCLAEGAVEGNWGQCWVGNEQRWILEHYMTGNSIKNNIVTVSHGHSIEK